MPLSAKHKITGGCRASTSARRPRVFTSPRKTLGRRPSRALAAQPRPSSAGHPVQKPTSALAALGRGRSRGGQVPGGQPLPRGFSFTVACPPARPCPHLPNYALHEPSVFPASSRGNSPNPRSSMHVHPDGLEVCPQAGTPRELTLVHPWLWTHAGGTRGIHVQPTTASWSLCPRMPPSLLRARLPGTGTGTSPGPGQHREQGCCSRTLDSRRKTR